MSRSIWKGLYCDLSINHNIILKKKIDIWSRRSSIPHFLINKIVFVHNGKTFKKLLITREKVGFKFGEFVFTKTRLKKIINKKNK